MKRVIALGMLVLGVLLVGPTSGASAAGCPPGQTGTPPYCQNVPPEPPELNTHFTIENGGGTVSFTLECTASKGCKGTVLLELKGAGGSASSSALASAGTTVGRTSYSIASGHKATVHVKLSKHGRALLKRKGKIKVAVVSVSDGKRTVLGSLTIKAKKKHVTHTHGHPGFTG